MVAESAGGPVDGLVPNTCDSSTAEDSAINGSQPAHAGQSHINIKPTNVTKGGGDASGEIPAGKKQLHRIPTITIDDSFVEDVGNDSDCEIIEDISVKPVPPVITIDNEDINNDREETVLTSVDSKRTGTVESVSQNDHKTDSEAKLRTEIKKEKNERDEHVPEENNDSQDKVSDVSTDLYATSLEDSKLNTIESGERNTVEVENISSATITSPDETNMIEPKEDEKKDDEPLDILGNGLLLKQVIKQGDCSATRAINGDRVTVRTDGRLEDGTVVDNDDSLTFTLGDGDVVQAWDVCVSLMYLGEVCQLVTDCKYAYGKQGRSPDVPGNAKITYTIELLGKDAGLSISSLTVQERLSHGNDKRERGNYLFGRNDYTGSINSYSKALKILNDENSSHSAEPSVLQELVDVRMKCYNNMAAAQIKVDAYDAAMKSCDAVLRVQPDNVKALFRKGKSLAAKGKTEPAVTILRKAIKIDPESKIVQQELFKLTKKLKKETENEKDVYRKMFGQKKPSSEEKSKNNTWKKWGLLATGAISAILLSVGIAVYRNMNH